MQDGVLQWLTRSFVARVDRHEEYVVSNLSHQWELDNNARNDYHCDIWKQSNLTRRVLGRGKIKGPSKVFQISIRTPIISK